MKLRSKKDKPDAPEEPGAAAAPVEESDVAADLERNLPEDQVLNKVVINSEIKGRRRSNSKVVLERLSKSREEAAEGEKLDAPTSPTKQNLLSPRAVAPLDAHEGIVLFSLPKLCKWFSEQKRPLDLLVKLVTDLRDPVKGMQPQKKLVGLSRMEIFGEKELLQWLVKNKFTAAASTAGRFVELLQKDYVISEAKKGYYRFLDDDERQKARIEEEKLIEQKVQQKLAQLAKDQKKAQKRSKKNSVVYTPVIGEDLAVCIENQKAEYPSLTVPFLLVRFAADVIALNGEKEEGIFRLSVGTEEVAQMVHQINSEHNYTLMRRDPNIAAVMMKRYLRDLPQPLCIDYDGALKLAKSRASDDDFNAFFDALAPANQAVIRFIANFIHRMTRPETVLNTKMDVNNYSIVFTPGFLRSKAVDLAAMANGPFENEFTTRLVQIIRKRFPDDTVGDPEHVPRPVGPKSLTSSADLRILIADESAVKTPEDLIREAEERLKAAKKDLHTARKMEQKEQKKGVSLRKSSIGKDDADAFAPTGPLSPVSPGGRLGGKKPRAASPRNDKSPREKPPVPVQRPDLAQAGAPMMNDTPPKPQRAPPTMDGAPVSDRNRAPSLPPLPPPDFEPSPPVPAPRDAATIPASTPTSVDRPQPPSRTPPSITMQGSHEVPPEIQAHLMSPRVPMNDFEVFLNESGVLDYVDAFNDYGLETIEDLLEMDENDLDEIGLKASYREEFVRNLRKLKEEHRQGDDVQPGSAPDAVQQETASSDAPGEIEVDAESTAGKKSNAESDGNESNEGDERPPAYNAVASGSEDDSDDLIILAKSVPTEGGFLQTNAPPKVEDAPPKADEAANKLVVPKHPAEPEPDADNATVEAPGPMHEPKAEEKVEDVKEDVQGDEETQEVEEASPAQADDDNVPSELSEQATFKEDNYMVSGGASTVASGFDEAAAPPENVEQDAEADIKDEATAGAETAKVETATPVIVVDHADVPMSPPESVIEVASNENSSDGSDPDVAPEVGTGGLGGSVPAVTLLSVEKPPRRKKKTVRRRRRLTRTSSTGRRSRSNSRGARSIEESGSDYSDGPEEHTETSGDLTSEDPSEATLVDYSELLELFVKVRSDIVAQNDTGVLRQCRSCTEKVMQIVSEADGDEADKAQSIQRKLVQLNGAVMGVLKSSYGEVEIAKANEVLDELETLCAQ